MEENEDIRMYSSSESDNDLYSSNKGGGDQQKEEAALAMNELGIFSSALGGTDLSDSDSDDSQLEENRSFSDGEDGDDPEWLPEMKRKTGTPGKHRPAVSLDSEFELFRQIENDLFQDRMGLDLAHPYEEELPDSLKEELALCYDESYDSEVDEGDMNVGEIAEQASKFFSELHQAGKAQRKLLKGFDGPFINKNPQRLPTHLEPVMGSANLAIAQQKFSDAIDLCNEVIRQAPCCSEPYINLALIYKELDDSDRYFQFTLLALHINSFDRSHPRQEDADSWEQLGIIAKERGDLLMALECLKKSLHAAPRRPGVLWLQGEIRLELKQYQAALRTFEKIEKVINDKASNQEMCEVTRRKSLILFESGNIRAAIEAVFQRLGKGWQVEAVVELFNLLLELLFIEKDYVTALKTAVILFGSLSTDVPTPCEEVQTQDVVEDMEQNGADISEGILITEETQTVEKKKSSLELFFKDFCLDSSRDPNFGTDCTGGFLVMIEGNQVLIPVDSFTGLPLDLQAKLAIPSIHTGNLELAHHLITHALRDLPIAEHGDLWLDVCESLMDQGQSDLSVDLLRTVLECERYDEPGVWLMLARSLEAVSVRDEVWEDSTEKPVLDEAIQWYKKVLVDIPENAESRILLANVYHRKGMKEEAISLLAEGQQGTKYFLSNKDSLELKTPPDIRVIHRRTMLHQENGETEQCLDGFLTLLDYYFREVYLLKSFQLMVIPFLNSDKTMKKYGKAAKLHSRYQAEEEEQDHYLTLSQWYNVFKSTCQLLGKRGKREELFRLVIAANMVRKFHNTEYTLDVQLITVSVCVMQRSLYYAYRFSRPLLQLIGKSNTFANLFNCITENQYLTRNLSIKTLRRMWFEDPRNHRVAQLFALALLSVGSFHLSLLVLHEAFKLNPDNPRLLFFMAMAYIRLANNRTHVNKNAFISQAFALIFKYKEKMGDCAEVYYNIGRAFHAIGFKHWASHYYRLVLTQQSLYRVPTGQKCDSQLIELSSLKREAGFNLSLIYEESGSFELSRDILQRYCVV